MLIRDHSSSTALSRSPLPRFEATAAAAAKAATAAFPESSRAASRASTLGVAASSPVATDLPVASASVYVVTGSRLYRDGLRALLDQEDGFAVCSTAGTLSGALTEISHGDLQPDIALVDVDPAGAPGAVEMLRGQVPGVRIVVLGVRETEADVLRWVEAGVDGYVPREASLDRLVEMLRAVTRGESLCSPAIVAMLMKQVAAKASAPLAAPTKSSAVAALTRRERQIAELIDEGLSNKQIAAQLQIEMATVKNHVHNLLEKLGCARRQEAAALLRAAQI